MGLGNKLISGSFLLRRLENVKYASKDAFNEKFEGWEHLRLYTHYPISSVTNKTHPVSSSKDPFFFFF